MHAFIAAEDARFMSHHGVDFSEILSSIFENYRAHRIVRGASTITQQVVRLAFLDQERSFLRKYREALGALVLELYLSKEEIFEWYINLAYFGEGHYGLRGACDHYFATSPDLLTINQSIYLALLLPSPSKSSHVLLRKKLDQSEKSRFIRILKQMHLTGFITEQERQQSFLTGDFGSPLELQIDDDL